MRDAFRKYWRDWYFLTLVFLLALGVRVLFVLQWHDTPYGAVPLLDARAYDDWAMDIAAGHWLRPTAFYQSPLYPYVLGVFYSIFGHSLLGAGLLNAVLGAVTVVMLAALTENLFGRIAAIVTAALATFYLPFIFYTAPVMKEPLGLFLLTLFMVPALQALRGHRARDYAASGFALGLAVLVRGNLLLLLPLVPLVVFVRRGHQAFRGVTVFVCAVFLALAPATLHNFIVAQDLVPISYADGFNLYIGHFAGANGTNAYPPEVSTDPQQEELAVRYTAEQAAGAPQSPSQISAYWRGRAFEFMVQNPAQEFVLLKNKVQAFWNDAQPFDNYDIGFIAKNFGTIIAQPLFTFWIVAVLAVFSTVAIFRMRTFSFFNKKWFDVGVLAAMVFIYMCAVMLFYVTDRYRLPVVVFLLPLAGAAAPTLQYMLNHRYYKPLVEASAIALIMMIFIIQPPPNSVDLTPFHWGTLASIYDDLGEDLKTLDALEQGMRLAPDQMGAQAFVRGAVASDRLGRDDIARRWLDMAITLYPNDGVAWYNVGRMRAAHGNLDLALQSFLKARELNPTYTLTYFALAKVYDKQGKQDAARDALRAGLRIDPYNARLKGLAAEWGVQQP